jgi:predicted alpha/beta-fold hydrolase
MDVRRRALVTLCLAASFAASGCTGLRPLPQPAVGPCPAPATLTHLWSCLDATDHDVGVDVTAPRPRESAFRSTQRVTAGDLRRKLRDQHRGSACGGPVPPGFESIEQPPAAAGRAPLRAYYRPAAAGTAKPTILVVHGLYDSKHSRYVRLAAQFLAGRGYGVLVPDMRFHGCLLGDYLPTLGREEAADLVAWSGWLRAQQPGTEVGLLGFSLGSLDALQALAIDDGGEAFHAGGVLISPPASLPETIARLDDPPSLLHRGRQALLVAFFQRALATRMRELGIPAPPGGSLRERPFARLLDWLSRQPSVAAPDTTAAALVAQADPEAAFQRVRRPLLLISSRRDPIYAESAVAELRRATANPNVHLIVTTDGGHIGFQGSYPAWTAAVLDRFFASSAGR